jgi:hypothetical protein
MTTILRINFVLKRVEDTKWEIRICKSKKDRQQNGEKEKGQKEKYYT